MLAGVSSFHAAKIGSSSQARHGEELGAQLGQLAVPVQAIAAQVCWTHGHRPLRWSRSARTETGYLATYGRRPARRGVATGAHSQSHGVLQEVGRSRKAMQSQRHLRALPGQRANRSRTSQVAEWSR